MLAPARIEFRGDQPFSLDFNDIYHAADGAAEVRRVFMGPCAVAHLAASRARHALPAKTTVRIGELGFGSGLNFVVAARECLAAGARLHFFSFEAHPIDAQDFAAIAAGRFAREPLYRELAAAYPPRLRGWHQRSLAEGRVCLWLWFGDAAAGLADLEGRQRQGMDAWFLDGFAPDRNPALWEAALFQRLAALSRHGTRLATFTAAGRVRRALNSVGFRMERVDQRPYKRESLAGTFDGPGLSGVEPPNQVLVIGGGLAGASAAWQLARAGCRVQLLDAMVDPAAGTLQPGSRMPATVMHARLLADGSATGALRCHAYLHAVSLLRGLPGVHAGGVLQLSGDRQPPGRLQAVAARYGASGNWIRWLDAPAAQALAEWPVGSGGLYLEDAATVDIPVLLTALTAHAGIDVECRRVTALPNDIPVILACGTGIRDFPAARYLELSAVHGQLDLVDMHAAPALPLVGAGYLVPARGAAAGDLPMGQRRVAAGSTYEYRPWDPAQASRANLAQLDGQAFTWRGRCRGTRSVSSDRTAIAGPLYDANGQALSELLVSGGHGSAGNVSAHMAGAVLTAHLTGDCPPLQQPLAAALSPRRFRERQARRGVRHGSRS